MVLYSNASKTLPELRDIWVYILSFIPARSNFFSSSSLTSKYLWLLYHGLFWFLSSMILASDGFKKKWTISFQDELARCELYLWLKREHLQSSVQQTMTSVLMILDHLLKISVNQDYRVLTYRWRRSMTEFVAVYSSFRLLNQFQTHCCLCIFQVQIFYRCPC